jgi:hypothetical protein
MSHERVTSLCIAARAGEPLQNVPDVLAIEGRGLQGDRYCNGEGSFNRGRVGSRQVTLINARFLAVSFYTCADSRRNIAVDGVELMWLIGREFDIGQARFRGVKYCDPCDRPRKLSGKAQDFQWKFHDKGGLVAEVVRGGLIRVGDAIVPPPKVY